MESSYDILQFYGWWQFSVCSFAFVGLMAIWFHIGRKQDDVGQVFLALSILSWAVSGLVEVYYSSWAIIGSDNFAWDGWRSVLSLLNSLFILLALPWFKYLPSPLHGIIKSPYWKIIVGLPFLFSLLPTISKILTGNQNNIISELDVYYSVLTLIILAGVLWTSFVRRNLRILAYLSIVSILITFAAQIYKLTDSDVNMILFSAIFKTSLIMIFFALALSWVKDFTQKIGSSLGDIVLYFNEHSSPNALVTFEGISGFHGKEIPLSEKNKSLLQCFIDKRLNSDGWLEIKPKSFVRDGRQFDINDHNEIKRLLHSLLDGAFGKKKWSKDGHYDPLKKMLFEMSQNRERKIRIAIPKTNLKRLS